jgi:hypothetical protein
MKANISAMQQCTVVGSSDWVGGWGEETEIVMEPPHYFEDSRIHPAKMLASPFASHTADAARRS